MTFHVIASKGIGANLLKLGTKRRRTKAEIAEVKLEEEMKVEAEAAKTQRILELEHELQEMKQSQANNTAAAEILTDMMNKGHVKQNKDGSVSVLKQLDEEGPLDKEIHEVLEGDY